MATSSAKATARASSRFAWPSFTATARTGWPPPLQPGLLPPEVGRDADGSVRSVLQKRGQRLGSSQGMKDVAAARHFRHGQGLSGPDSLAGVGDGRLGLEALVLRLQQPDAPGVGVAVILQAQQVTPRSEPWQTNVRARISCRNQAFVTGR